MMDKVKSEKWKRSIGDRVVSIISFVAVLLLLVSTVGGCGKSGDGTGVESSVKTDGGTGTSITEKSKQADTLVIKGLYIGQKGDDALEACKKVATSSEDLIVVDFRNGIEVEREVGLGEYEKQQKKAWHLNQRKRLEALRKGVSSNQVDAMGLKACSWDDWKKLHPPTEEELAASKKKVKEVVSKKNLIQVSAKKNGVREDKLPGLAFVWVDDQGNVKEVRFNENGMDRLFNAGELSGEEFAKSVVNNYSTIPSLKQEVEENEVRVGNGEYIRVKESTWIHKNPKGYQVKIFERSAYYNNGILKLNAKKAASDSPLMFALSLANKSPLKYFTIFAIKPESARKFD